MAQSGIASIGECMLELSGHDGDLWRMGFAGDTFNTAWTLRALTGPTVAVDYVTAFGDDPFSDRQVSFFTDNGIGIAESPRISGARPGLYAITLDGAERSFTYWRRDAAARRLADDPQCLVRSLGNRRLIYFSGITLAILTPPARQTLIAAIAAARESGARIAFDPNYRPTLWESPEAARVALDEALAVTDVALPTFPDEQALYGDAAPQATAARLRAAGIGEIVAKDGAAPALISVDGTERIVDAVTVEKPVDTTGAGDSFNGGYLAARLAGDDPEQAARRAHNVAAAVVQTRGALAPFEMLREAFSR